MRQRRPREKNNAHLAFIRTLPCIVTGMVPVEAAHIRFGEPSLGKRPVGLGERPDDKWTLPLCADQHRRQHSMNERDYWNEVGIDPLRYALKLWEASGDYEVGVKIIAKARQ